MEKFDYLQKPTPNELRELYPNRESQKAITTFKAKFAKLKLKAINGETIAISYNYLCNGSFSGKIDKCKAIRLLLDNIPLNENEIIYGKNCIYLNKWAIK